MRKSWLGLVVLVLGFLVGCRGEGILVGASGGVASPIGAGPATAPLAVSFTELLSRPAVFEGALLQISGELRRQPELVCSTKHHPSPAPWILLNDGQILPAGGLLDRLVSQAPAAQEVTVVGRWLRWQGPFGCGRQAREIELWYLEANQILAPNPVAFRSPLTPVEQTAAEPEVEESPQEVSQAELPPKPPGDGTPTPTDEAEPGGPPTPTATLVILPTNSPVATAGAATSTATPSPAPGATGAPTTSPTALATSASGTVTPPASPASATATATTGAGAPSATPTPTEEATDTPTIVDQETLPPGSLETATLGQSEIHRWPFVISSTTAITVNVDSEIALDLAIEVRNPSGNTIGEVNSAQNGQPEILVDLSLPQIGTYEILVSAPTGATGRYAILVQDSLTYGFIFQGTVAYGGSTNSFIQAQNDHFWHFLGTAGETATITVTPSDSSDLFLRIFGPDGSLLLGFHNENAAGMPEVLVYPLPDTGLFSVLVGELNFEPSQYAFALAGG